MFIDTVLNTVRAKLIKKNYKKIGPYLAKVAWVHVPG